MFRGLRQSAPNVSELPERLPPTCGDRRQVGDQQRDSNEWSAPWPPERRAGPKDASITRQASDRG
eukprot:7498253-Alexandrium_andersonii.AAC.1